MIPGVLALLGPIGVAFLVLLRPGFSGPLLRVNAALSVGLGLGTAFCVHFLGLVLGFTGWQLLVADAALLLGLAGLFLGLVGQQRHGQDALALPQEPRSAWATAARVIFLVLLLGGLYRFALDCWASPHGDWDAWAIWNLRARFLFRAGDSWRAAFSPLLPWSHPDYPLLVPVTVVRAWLHDGHETTLIPQLVAGLFTFGTVGLLVAAVTLLRGPTQGYLASCILLGTVGFIDLGSAQYADVPLAYFLLAVAVLLALHDRGQGTITLPVLAGFVTGLAAWTKNEGQLFAVVVVAVRIVALFRTAGAPACCREMGAFFLGLLPPLALLVSFKLLLAPPSDLIAAQSWATTLPKLTDGGRYLLILGTFAGQLALLGPAAIPVLVGYFLLLGRCCDAPLRRSAGQLFLVLALMLAGYFVVYLTSPWDNVAIHLGTSLDRLLLQLWPTALFTFFLLVASPLSPGEP
jgi:hypothetical protein